MVAVGIIGTILTTVGLTVTTLLMNFDRPISQQTLLQQGLLVTGFHTILK
jgi:hypothetical protein